LAGAVFAFADVVFADVALSAGWPVSVNAIWKASIATTGSRVTISRINGYDEGGDKLLIKPAS